MKQEKISVLLPVYNTDELYLKPCIDSILNQTFQDFELVIVNNGSTNEKTNAVINKFSKLANVIVIDVPQQSGKKNLSVALNQGLLKCSHELVARMDSDDIMHPERLQKQLDYFNENWDDVDILGTQLNTVWFEYAENNNKSHTKHAEIIPQDAYKNSDHFCNHPTIMFKRSVIIELGGYQDAPNHIPEDFCLWAKAQKRGYKIRNLQDVLLFYRETAIGLSLEGSQRSEWYQAIEESRKSMFDFKRYI